MTRSHSNIILPQFVLCQQWTHVLGEKQVEGRINITSITINCCKSFYQDAIGVSTEYKLNYSSPSCQLSDPFLQNLVADVEAITTADLNQTSRGILVFLMILEQDSVSFISVVVIVSNTHYIYCSLQSLYLLVSLSAFLLLKVVVLQ